MAAGDDTTMTFDAIEPITARQREGIQRAVDLARSICGFAFAVHVGPVPSRDAAVAIHAGLADPAGAVLVAVDPDRRVIEVVTGTRVAVPLDDRACEFAVLSMTSSFATGDLVGGIREGVVQLAEHARAPKVWHLDQPE